MYHKNCSIQFKETLLNTITVFTPKHAYISFAFLAIQDKTRKKNDDLHTNMFYPYMEGIGPSWT